MRRSAQRVSRQQQEAQQRQQLSVDGALDTLQSMFSTVEREVIHMILIEGCGGNMEAAVEALLQMSGGISSETKTKKAITNPSQLQKAHKTEQQQLQHALQQSSINLPSDFLRPPSYFLAKFTGDPKTHAIDSNVEQQKQMVDDELFAKAIFEDSLFAADLHANPEWVLEEMNANATSNKYQSSSFSNANRSLSQQQKIDPSDMQARRMSFKQRFNNLGLSAKAKIADLAQKLQRHKQESKVSHDYTSVLTSLDDEPLMEDESLVVEDVSELHRGTYSPPVKYIKKPEQAL